MKLFLVFGIVIFLCTCANNSQSEEGKTVHIYITGCDSIFYCEGEKFNLEKLKGGRKDDSAFINKLIENILPPSINILLKPLGGSCGGVGETLVNLIAVFKKNNLIYIIAKAEPLEENYFDDITFSELYPNSDGLPIQLRNIGFPKKYYLIFVTTKNDKIYYQYDTTAVSTNLIPIKPSSTEAVIKIISEIETKYKVNFSNGNIILKGNYREIWAYYKIEDALQQKNIFKFGTEIIMD